MDKQFYVDLLDHLDDGVYFVDPQRRITYWNGGAERLTGYAADEVVGHSCADGILRHVNGAGKVICRSGCPLSAVMRDGIEREASVFMHHADGHRVPVRVRGRALRNEAGEIIGAVELFTNQLPGNYGDATRRRARDDSATDPVTGLPTRRYGELFLETSLKAVANGEATVGLLFIDADHFKSVNDRLGHQTGDLVLRMVGRSLANGLRRGDLPIRWGGEEFVAVALGIDQPGLETLAERVRMLVEHSWLDHSSERTAVTVSIGAALARPGDTVASLCDRADRLMYQSKRRGRNRVTSERGEVPVTSKLAVVPPAREERVEITDESSRSA